MSKQEEVKIRKIYKALYAISEVLLEIVGTEGVYSDRVCKKLDKALKSINDILPLP